MRIGEKVRVRGVVDEIRKETVIIKNRGGYFGTDPREIETDGCEPKTDDRSRILRAVGRYIQTQAEENGLKALGVNGYVYGIEDVLQELDAMLKEDETPKRIILGDIIDLIDPEAEDDITIMDRNGNIALVGSAKSRYWEPYKEKQVEDIMVVGSILRVWLKEEEDDGDEEREE